MTRDKHQTGTENFFDEDDIIVSKTGLKGRITYCNDVFLKIAGYTEEECLGRQHSMIRHPDMPRCIFNVLWETIQNGNEIFAYVINRCKNGDHYWVYAHVTPSFDVSGRIVGYHSNRRVPDRAILNDTIIPLYAALKAEEDQGSNRKEGMQRSTQMVLDLLENEGKEYDEWILTLGQNNKKIAA